MGQRPEANGVTLKRQLFRFFLQTNKIPRNLFVDGIMSIAIITDKYIHSACRVAIGINVVDIDLPDMSGFDLTREAKMLCPNIAVVMITGFIEKFSYDEAIKAGALDFLKKPFTPKELIARVAQVRINGQLRKREEELKKKVEELQEFYDIAVGRESRMLELKNEIARLKKQLEGYK